MGACAECHRLLSLCLDASEKLIEAQAELAQYQVSRDEDRFQELWRVCRQASEEINSIRQDVARHLSSHGP